MSYTPNVGATAYIVDKPYLQQMFAGTGTNGTLLSETQMSYDGRAYQAPPTSGDVTKVRRRISLADDWAIETATFDLATGNKLTETDAALDTTTYEYDTLYNLFVVKTTNAAGEETRATWNAGCQLPINQWDVNNGLSTWTYDALCRKTNVTRPGGDSTTWSYIALGNPANQATKEASPAPNDASGDMWTITQFDGLGRAWRARKKAVNEAGAASETVMDTTYDKRDRRIGVTAPYYTGETSYTTRTAYDAADRVISVTQPDGAVTETSYTAPPAGYFSQVVTKEPTLAPQIRETRVLSDAYGNVLRTSRMLGATAVNTDVAYDALDRPTTITDAGGSVWRNTYDMLGRRTKAEDPDLGMGDQAWTYVYDAAGRLTKQTDARGAVTTLEYGLLGRVAKKRVAITGQPAQVTWSHYSKARTGFKNVGRLTRQDNGAARVCFDYDEAGSKVRERWTFPGPARRQPPGPSVPRTRQRQSSSSRQPTTAAGGSSGASIPMVEPIRTARPPAT